MKIALLGYGKMGKVIEEIAIDKGHQIIVKIDSAKDWEKNKNILKDIDVAIDFSIPETVIENINNCFNNNIPIVVGTTGWYDNIENIKKLCNEKDQSLIWASNFSIGVNIFFKVNQYLAKWMNNYDEYEVSMEEIHHTAKLDAPSGTAISLANGIISELERKTTWKLGKEVNQDELSIEAKRIDPVPGTHSISYDSDIDTIEIKHSAKNRKGFAKGSILAAEWLADKKGFYEFKEVFF